MLRIILSHVFLPWCGGRANRCVQSWRCAEQTLCWCHTSSCHIPQTRWTSRPPSQFQRQSDSQSGTRAHSAHVSLSFWLCLNHEKVQSISLAANNPQDDEHKNAQHSFVHSQLKEVDVSNDLNSLLNPKYTSSSSSWIVDEYLILLCPHALAKCVLTWNSNGKLFWLDGQKPPTQLIVTAVCRTNQSDGAFPTGRLVIKGHLFIGQDVIIVWRDRQGGG